jgi:hypothetical protein
LTRESPASLETTLLCEDPTVSAKLCLLKFPSNFSLEDQACITLSSEIETNPLFQDILSALSKNEALKKRMLDRGTILQVESAYLNLASINFH